MLEILCGLPANHESLVCLDSAGKLWDKSCAITGSTVLANNSLSQ